MQGDTRAAIYARKYRKWCRWIAELRAAGVEIKEPPNFDVHPDFRTKTT